MVVCSTILFFLHPAAAHDRFIGDFIYVEVFGMPMLYINKYETAVELLNKRSSIYSSRPHFVMAMDLYVLLILFIGIWVKCQLLM